MASAEFDLTDKVAIVTGGGSGIGQSLVHALAQHGANVIVVDAIRELADAVAHEVEARGVGALAVHADVCDPGDVDQMVDTAVAHFGRVDVLVNNAGGRRRDGQASPLETWRQTIDLSLTSTFLCSQK